MKIVFFLALLINLIFFLWQYNAGAFHHVTDDAQIAPAEPKQIWLLSELAQKQPATVIKTPIPPTTLSITAPAAVITRATKNNPQHLVTSTLTNTATTEPAK
jgi:hypothetical protein